MAHPGSTPDPLDDFTDEESVESREARSAIPTNEEIDALFLDEEETDAPPRGAAPPRTHESRLASIFEDSGEPALRNYARKRSPGPDREGQASRSSPRSPTEGFRATLAAVNRNVRHLARGVRGRLEASWPLGRTRSPGQRGLLGGPVEFTRESRDPEPADSGQLAASAPAAVEPRQNPVVRAAAPAAEAEPVAVPPPTGRSSAPVAPRAQPVPARAPAPMAPPERPRTAPPRAAPRRRRRRQPRQATWTQVIVGTAILSVLTYVAVIRLADVAPGVNTGVGSLTLSSEPAGARVFIDGVEQAVTPATLSLPAGEHVLELRTGDVSKTMPILIAGGSEISRTFDLNTRAKPGRLEVRTTPPGAQVFVDGRHRGQSPVTLTDVHPGRRTVLVQRGTQSAEAEVTVDSGATAVTSLTLAEATVATMGRATGWLAVRAPMELEVFEDGRSLGTTRAGRLELPPGRRTVELVNDLYGVRTRRPVDVAAGKSTIVRLEIPPGEVTVNAIPWADVRLDGRLLGRTPVADLKVEAGRHELQLSHPQHGQRRLTIHVGSGRPLVVTTDLRK